MYGREIKSNGRPSDWLRPGRAALPEEEVRKHALVVLAIGLLAHLSQNLMLLELRLEVTGQLYQATLSASLSFPFSCPASAHSWIA